ncbi:RES family NAD+ phosphorylase [Mesorhizobium sp. CA4]|uniref:RES family NAD+ phosphorylase n=1 Tax=Mesorhizobium sp. CA4 TaxID=588499 RepID=UPI001CD0FE3B|nr:RES family NAD+ phosphorylase [Mesorhizobium sp. CA4]MBZ9821940.1 RES family NAD+ phosphorylase [Mesorhizobium sp. CA4]
MNINLTQLTRYNRFRNEIIYPESRALSQEAEEFLSALHSGADHRAVALKPGERFWRAQIGNDVVETEDGRINVYAFRPERMKPSAQFAKVNRASPAGVPILYLATDAETAMSELRPWFGVDFSVAEFKVTKPLRIANCVKTGGGFPLYMGGDDTPDYRSEAAWGFASDAFSRPVQSGEEQQYRVTQFIAESLNGQGFDGIMYKSLCTSGGRNLALFDLGSADVCSLHLFRVKSLRHEFEPSGESEII